MKLLDRVTSALKAAREHLGFDKRVEAEKEVLEQAAAELEKTTGPTGRLSTMGYLRSLVGEPSKHAGGRARYLGVGLTETRREKDRRIRRHLRRIQKASRRRNRAA